MTMFGLTLWEPWASAIRVGAKTIETRSWGPPAFMVDPKDRKPILITAAKRWNRELLGHWTSPILRPLIEQPPGFHDDARTMWKPDTLGTAVAAGWVIAAHQVERPEAEIDGPRDLVLYLDSLDEDPEPVAEAVSGCWARSDIEVALGDYSDGRWAWILDVQPIPEPFPIRGGQGLFEVAPEIEDQVRGLVDLGTAP